MIFFWFVPAKVYTESWIFPGASQIIQEDLPVNVEKTQAHPLQSSNNDSNVQFPLDGHTKKRME